MNCIRCFYLANFAPYDEHGRPIRDHEIDLTTLIVLNAFRDRNKRLPNNREEFYFAWDNRNIL